MKNLSVVSLIFILTSCASAPPSVAGLYGPDPVSQSISGSNAQALINRVLEFTDEEVFEATKSAMLRLGYNTHGNELKKGMISANGYYECGGSLRPPVTMAVYFKQLNTKPETKLTIILDRHDTQCWGSGESKAANQLATEIQKVLSTY